MTWTTVCKIDLPTSFAPWLAIMSGVSSEHLSHGISFELCDDDDDVDDDNDTMLPEDIACMLYYSRVEYG